MKTNRRTSSGSKQSLPDKKDQDFVGRPPRVSTNEYERHLQRARAAGNWFIFNRLYLKVLPKLTALFLQDIINLLANPSTPREGGWSMCTTAFLEGYGWSRKEQERHLLELKRKEYILTKKVGVPPLRWIKVDLLFIERDIDYKEWQNQLDQSPPRRRCPITPIWG